MASPKVYVTRKLHFSAAHRLYNPNWPAEKNEEVFGLCNNPNWHGHNYELFVTVAGAPQEDTGYVVDLGKLKRIVNQHVVDKVDHKNLNLDVDFMMDKITSTENFAVEIWNILVDKVRPAELVSVKLYETERNFVEYRGEVLESGEEPARQSEAVHSHA
jgi:6-pyruvoyltetrahydropterin/6-carboxytetrahydropterin synthase